MYTVTYEMEIIIIEEKVRLTKRDFNPHALQKTTIVEALKTEN